MKTSIPWYFAAAFLTLIMGPISMFVPQVGQSDGAGLYIIVDGGRSSLSQDGLLSYGASGVGPKHGRLVQMIHAPPSSKEQLSLAGYIMFPASAFAAICGIETDSTNLTKGA